MDDNVQVQRIALKAIIFNQQGQILLLREADTYEEGTNVGRFQVPGGRLEVGEHWEDGLRREVMEETGLQIEIDRPLLVSEWRPVIKGVQNQIVGVFFACHASTTDVRLSLEHDDFAWVSKDEALGYDLVGKEKDAIEAYFAS